eukprot:3620763-Pleurochrysis_carterae.AAC.2
MCALQRTILKLGLRSRRERTLDTPSTLALLDGRMACQISAIYGHSGCSQLHPAVCEQGSLGCLGYHALGVAHAGANDSTTRKTRHVIAARRLPDDRPRRRAAASAGVCAANASRVYACWSRVPLAHRSPLRVNVAQPAWAHALDGQMERRRPTSSQSGRHFSASGGMGEILRPLGLEPNCHFCQAQNSSCLFALEPNTAAVPCATRP